MAEESNTSQRKTMLIVDDYGPLRKTLAVAFEDLGATCIEAADGAEALCILKYNSSIDLILLDLYMPNVDGMTVALELSERVKAGARQIPIVFLTSESQKTIVSKGIKAGVDAWIIKPPQMETIQEIYTRYLSYTKSA